MLENNSSKSRQSKSVGCPLCGAASEHTLSACLGNLAAERDRYKAALKAIAHNDGGWCGDKARAALHPDADDG